MFRQSLIVVGPPWRLGSSAGDGAGRGRSGPAVVAYYPAAPVVTYVPEVRGLFGKGSFIVRCLPRPSGRRHARTGVVAAPMVTT